MSCKVVSSEADLPILQKMLLAVFLDAIVNVRCPGSTAYLLVLCGLLYLCAG